MPSHIMAVAATVLQCFSRVWICAWLFYLSCCPKWSGLLECRGLQQKRRQGWEWWECEWCSVSGVDRHMRHQGLQLILKVTSHALKLVFPVDPRYEKGLSEAMNWACCCCTFIFCSDSWGFERMSNRFRP